MKTNNVSTEESGVGEENLILERVLASPKEETLFSKGP